ncbi:MAG: DUF433 domain-containing protein [Candidatus Brockarchaeota archaeon]|nr:DUF433 domain-containing protein [Candidatus Brockarchaeota archaeon]
MRVEVNEYIVIDSEICHGKPTFKGTRIMVWQVLEMLKAGCGFEDILKEFPSLTVGHIKAALDFAAKKVAGESLVQA